jgi:hypothetical protein
MIGEKDSVLQKMGKWTWLQSSATERFVKGLTFDLSGPPKAGPLEGRVRRRVLKITIERRRLETLDKEIPCAVTQWFAFHCYFSQ